MNAINDTLRFVVLGLLLSQSVAAKRLAPDEWVEAAHSNQELTTLINVETIVNDGQFRKAWTLTTWKTEQSVAGNSFRSVMSVELYDCKKRVTATRSAHLYEGLLGSGKLVHSISVDSAAAKWQEVPPGSPIDSALRLVCMAQIRS